MMVPRGGYGHFGRDDVFVPVTGAGADVARQRETGQRGHGDVVGTADAGFQHASAPHRDGVFAAEIVNAAGLQVAADASEFDVDDLAGAERDGGLGLLVGVDALVEADGRLQSFLDLHVAEQVVPAERLLDHHQVVGVDLLEQVEIFEAIGGVGVNGKLDARKFLADARRSRQVFARLDLDFDALVAGGEFVLDRVGKRSGESP